MILVEDLWISAIRLKGVKGLKVERWKSKTARGEFLALTVAKDRRKVSSGYQVTYLDSQQRLQIQQGHSCNLDNESLVTSR